jgi:hypothetical protein
MVHVALYLMPTSFEIIVQTVKFFFTLIPVMNKRFPLISCSTLPELIIGLTVHGRSCVRVLADQPEAKYQRLIYMLAMGFCSFKLS